MNIKEAIIEAQKNEHWFRPIRWSGLGQALCAVREGYMIEVVPTAKGGTPWFPAIVHLLDEWESVSPDEVLKERE